MNAFKTMLVTALLAGSAVVLRGDTRIELNGDWQFRIDPPQQGEQLGWTRQTPVETETVTVPHTWNIGSHDDFEGTAWYFKKFEVSEELLRKHAEIHFGATFYHARVWLNGVELGSHEGGHTAYHFDLTPQLERTNHLAVRINNQPGYATIPGFSMRLRGSDDTGNAWYDWWHYGGIVRDVWLTFDEPCLIRRQRIRVQLQGGSAEVESRVILENTTEKAVPAKLSLKAYAPGRTAPAAVAEQQLNLVPGSQDGVLRLRLEAPKLWHFDHPNLYRLEAELADGRGNVMDSDSDSFGVRKIEIRDRQLHLNGERVRLSGVTRHEDSPGEGLAETRGTIERDFDDLKNLQVTLTRPVHYPQHPAILDYCDRNGILLIPEIPMWQFSEKQMSDPRVVALAKQMLREMIEQAANHPSVMAWSVCNESATATPGGVAYFKAMRDWVKSLDPDRFVSYADDQVGREADGAASAAGDADFIMMNQYFGSWHGPAHWLTNVLERASARYPDKMFIISEFGLAGIFASDSESADRLRVRIIQDQMAVFARYDWIGGAIFWCYQDYKSHRNLWPGETAGYVEMGLVDENRQRRPSYFVWQELNSPVRAEAIWQCSSQYPYPPTGFSATVSQRSLAELPAYPLRDYQLTWEARQQDGRLIAQGQQVFSDLNRPVKISGEWKSTDFKSITLLLKIHRPTGFTACAKRLDWRNPISGGQVIRDMKDRDKVPAE